MKGKQLFWLAVAAIVLVLAATWKERREQAGPADIVGQPVFKNLPVNDIASIDITTETGTLHLVRKNDQWVLPSRFDCPVDFNRVRDALVKVADLKIGQVMHLDDSQRQAVKLVLPGTNVVNAGTLIRLQDGAGKELARLLLGDARRKLPENSPMSFGGYPDGQYVSPDDGRTIYLISETLFNFPSQHRDWMEADLLNLAPTDIARVNITGPERDPVELVRRADNQGLELPGLSKKEEADDTKLNNLQSSLSFLRIDDVADPSFKDDAMGFDKPIVFEATTLKGEIYRVKIGAPADASSNHYVRLEAALTPEAGLPPPASTNAAGATVTNAPATPPAGERPAMEARIADLNGKFSRWTYILAPHKISAFVYTRKDLIRKKEEKKD